MQGKVRTRIGTVGKAAGLMLAGAVAATALTGVSFADDTARSDSQAPEGQSQDRPWREPFGRGPGPGIPGMGPVLHGEQVVRTPEGGYREIAIQNGTISAVSATSITVTSEDGYEQTYAIGEQTQIRIDRDEAAAADLQADRPARVVADTAGTALHIGSATQDGAAALEQHRQMHQQFREDRAGQSQERLPRWQNGSGSA